MTRSADWANSVNRFDGLVLDLVGDVAGCGGEVYGDFEDLTVSGLIRSVVSTIEASWLNPETTS